MPDNKDHIAAANTDDGHYDALLNNLLESVVMVANKRIDDAQLSQQLLEAGVDTELVSDFRKLIENPVSHFLKSKDSINKVISDIMTKIVGTYLGRNKDIVKHAFRTKIQSESALHFTIVLEEDSYENRGQLLSFLTNYKQFDNWESHPINFQFVPEKLISKIEVMNQLV